MTTDPTSSEVEQRAVIAAIIDPAPWSRSEIEDCYYPAARRRLDARRVDSLAKADAIIAALRTGSGVADGYALVPVETTPIVESSLADAYDDRDDWAEIWPRFLALYAARKDAR